MKTIIYRFFVLIVILLGVMGVFAAPHPPSPGAKTNVPPPPGVPIDDNICGLVMIALLFGMYVVFKYPLKTKAPI